MIAVTNHIPTKEGGKKRRGTSHEKLWGVRALKALTIPGHSEGHTHAQGRAHAQESPGHPRLSPAGFTQAGRGGGNCLSGEGAQRTPRIEAAVSTPLTCACDDCHKVFKAFPLAKLPFCQGSTVAIIVHPHREMQSVRQGASEVHRVPFLDQFG